MVCTYQINFCNFSASRLSMTFNGNNPVVRETDKNITMQWNISLPSGSSIKFIESYHQDQSNKKTLIVSSEGGKPKVSEIGERHFGKRLVTDLVDSKFFLKIANAEYKDHGNYSVNVVWGETLAQTKVAVFVYIYGMFYVILVINGVVKFSEIQVSIK